MDTVQRPEAEHMKADVWKQEPEAENMRDNRMMEDPAPDIQMLQVREPTQPTVIIKIDSNHLEATLLLHPTSQNTADPTKEMLLDALKAYDIVYGINMPLLEDLCEKPVYYHVFVIARGEPAKVGRDGFVRYLVNTNPVLRPKIREDGIADYKDLGFLQIVYKDQPLCEIFPAEKGEDGIDLHGNVLEGQYGNDPINPVGKNTKLNDDKNVVHADVDGHVSVRQGIVSIVEVLKVDGDVDNSTGNIIFTGDVIVGGSVLEGFSIKCGGSIYVRGSVEGAILEASHDVSISDGLYGMERAWVLAGGNLRSRYIQSATVRVNGTIYADAIMFCSIECEGDMELTGKKGALIGGKTSVSGRLIAKSIGTSKHIATEVFMCATGTDVHEQIRQLQTQMEHIDSEILYTLQTRARLETIAQRGLLTPLQQREMELAKKRQAELEQQRTELSNRQLQMKKEQLDASPQISYIECRNAIHSNVSIHFGLAKLVVQDSFVHSRVHVVYGGIAISRL